MKQVLIRGGRAVVEEMPAPTCGEHEVLVRAAYSIISAGTETATVQESAAGLGASGWSHRLRKVGEVARMVRDRGLEDTRTAVRARLEGPSRVSGYSLSGTVLEVGAEVRDLVPGQRVACAGASSAHHAEIVAVPRNLVAPVPADLPLEQAACVTLGAIALQGVRQADVRLGEVVCVLGLGLIGQLTAALLRASGCRVVGTDIDPQRVERARALGLELAIDASGEELESQVLNLTGGNGADVAILTAASDSSELTRQAVRLIRRKGRVVVVGAVGMHLDRVPFYMKEAELHISCSYGPGRYDPSYEEEGRDYPFGYVRWTENRNMTEFLRLASVGAVALDGFLDHTFEIERAHDAYALLTEGPWEGKPLGVLLRYPEAPAEDADPVARVPVVPRKGTSQGLGVACVGPGSFARQVHLPNLAEMAPAATLRVVVGRSGNAARETARRFAAETASTDLDDVLRDDEIDLVLICTRHNLHAEQAARSLLAGKAVFLEKPAAIDLAGLETLRAAVKKSGRAFTLGLNRRFAPDVLALRAQLDKRHGPLVVTYRVNAGRLPADHWTLGPQGGGRLIGEACHMIDLLGFLVGQPRREHKLIPLAPQTACDLSLGDNFSLSCRYADGSVTNLIYTSLGHVRAGKERIECHWDGRTAVLDDFRRLEAHGLPGVDLERQEPDKGHAALLRAFVSHATGKAPAPISWDAIEDVSRFVLLLDREARGAAPGQP
jgi:predicted dehydrogenase/threonine dehydrogenase-like Zn-dependent dehydrogenase